MRGDEGVFANNNIYLSGIGRFNLGIIKRNVNGHKNTNIKQRGFRSQSWGGELLNDNRVKFVFLLDD